jgi:hypothetical protein
MQKHLISLVILLSLTTQSLAAPEIMAQEDGLLGLYPAAQFRLNQEQSCEDCRTVPQALWYFRNENIAVPLASAPIAGFSETLDAVQDIPKNLEMNALPPLVWVGSNLVMPNAQIDDAQTFYMGEDKTGPKHFYAIEDKIPTNLSFWDDSTTAFFKQRPVRMRGEETNRGFIARTVWPQDFKLDLNAKPQPLAENESLKSLVQFENGGAKSAYEARLLWGDASKSQGHAVLGVMLNGAQGDDDEAHGGHFAIATGRMEADGSYPKWLVNNYYNLASNSEKGIIAAPTPMDNYLADVNSGQSYYRPSYMLVAVFKTDSVPAQFQAATNRVYNHFYRNDFAYDHSRDNCAGIGLDTLRTLGWKVPERGVTSQLKATGAYFYISATDQSLSNGRAAYDYLSTETTRLFPAVTFDAIGENLLFGAQQWNRKLYTDHNPVTPFMQQIGDDIEAMYFVRIPQIPSSRAFGQAPVYSFDQFMTQAPADRSQWKVVPTTPNPMPENLKNGLALKLEKPSLVPWPAALVLLALLAALYWFWRIIKPRGKETHYPYFRRNTRHY